MAGLDLAGIGIAEPGATKSCIARIDPKGWHSRARLSLARHEWKAQGWAMRGLS